MSKEDAKRFCLSLTGGLFGVFLGFVFGYMSMYFYVARCSVYAQKPNVGNVDTTLLDTQNPAQTDGVVVIPNTKSFMQKVFLLWEFSNSENDVKLRKASDDGIETKAKVGVDFYLCEITDFYESLITILFSTIGITLFIGFLYVYNASKRRADDMARNALDEGSFKIKLDDQIDKAVAMKFTDNNLPEMVEEIEYTLNQIGEEKIIKRIKFLENEITKSSYPIANNVITEEPQEESSDGNN